MCSFVRSFVSAVVHSWGNPSESFILGLGHSATQTPAPLTIFHQFTEPHEVSVALVPSVFICGKSRLDVPLIELFVHRYIKTHLIIV